jgi:hypothetical protein
MHNDKSNGLRYQTGKSGSNTNAAPMSEVKGKDTTTNEPVPHMGFENSPEQINRQDSNRDCTKVRLHGQQGQ